ncbi:MAG: ABC transporter substrate-binding protein [Acidimicrobiia bacterium]
MTFHPTPFARAARAAVALGAILGLAACGGSAGTSDTTAAEAAPETTAAAPDFPVTVGDLTLEARPERIVSLSPTATEMLFAIGAGDQVVAVDDYSNYPVEAADLPRLDAYEPNVEAIIGLDPDLVIVTYDPGNLVAQLAAVDTPTFLAPAAADLEGVYAQIAQIGALTGRAADAAGLAASMRAEVDAIVAGVSVPAEPLTYYYELDDTLYSLTSRTFVGGVMSLLGLENVADGVEEGNDYPQLSAEIIVDADPDLILLADTKCCAQTAETVAARDGWAGLTAVREGRVVELDDDVASRWGPRIVDLLRAVAEAVAGVTAGS